MRFSSIFDFGDEIFRNLYNTNSCWKKIIVIPLNGNTKYHKSYDDSNAVEDLLTNALKEANKPDNNFKL